MESVAKVSTGSAAGRRNGDAFIGWNTDAGKLRDHPAIRQLVIKHNRITTARGLARSTEAIPQRADTYWAEHRRSSGLVENLKAFIGNLYVLGSTNFAIRVWWRAVAGHAGKGNAVNINCRTGHVRNDRVA